MSSAASKLEQHSKPILSPTRSLDEGFESDPDRVSTDSEHQTSATTVSSGTGNNNNNSNNNNASKLAQLSSAATGGASSSNSNNNSLTEKSTTRVVTGGALSLAAPQLQRREYYKEQLHHHQPHQQHQQQQQQHSQQIKQQQQRLQYQKQRQPLVASAASSIHNHRMTNGITGAAAGAANAASNYRRGRRLHMTPPARNALRSHSVDAIGRQRHGYDPSSLILKHDGNGNVSSSSSGSCSNGVGSGHVGANSRMLNYKSGASGVGSVGAASAAAAAAGGQAALLVQPISSATLSPLVAVGVDGVGVVDASGSSPVIASATHSLYTFYPAEGNLQVWQTECGDLTYKSSRNMHQLHKAPVCWTQSIPRQARR